VQGSRDNALLGYGLVVGLTNTGDTEQVLFTMQSVAGMLGRLGIRVDPREIRSRNVAAVMVTAKLPTFSRAGSTIDVTVSAMGNARSLQGGTLLMTPLTGADGLTYAVAQGPVQVGGFDANGGFASVRKNTPTSSTIPGGRPSRRPSPRRWTPVPSPCVSSAPTSPTPPASPPPSTFPRNAQREGHRRAAVEVKLPDADKDLPVQFLSRLEALTSRSTSAPRS